MGQEFGSLAGWFWFRISQDVSQDCSYLKDLFPRRLAYLAAGWRPQCLMMCAAPQGFSGFLTTWQLASSGESDAEREMQRENTGSHHALPDLVFKVSYFHFFIFFLCVRNESLSPAHTQEDGNCGLRVSLYGFSPLKVLEASLRAYYVFSFVTASPVYLKRQL